jgi:hypothetical protein
MLLNNSFKSLIQLVRKTVRIPIHYKTMRSKTDRLNMLTTRMTG